METSDQTQVRGGKWKSKAKRWLLLVVVVFVVRFADRKVVPYLQHRTQSINCGNHMVSIGYAAKLWANDNYRFPNHFPSDLLSMSNVLDAPKILICPSDHSRMPAASWASFTLVNSSYEIVNPDLQDGDANGVFLRCKIHGHLGYANGTVLRAKTF